MKKSTLLVSLSLFFFFGIKAQSNNDKFWSPVSESTIKQTGKRQIVPNKYLSFQLNGNDLKTQLLSAPLESNVKINQSTCIISLPVPNGTIQKFKVIESPIMEPGLAAQFPNIKTYSIKGIDDAYANGKLDWTPEYGFHAMVRTINGDYFIDPYCLENLTDYITYYTSDFTKDPSQKLPEVGVIKSEKEQSSTSPKKKGENEAAVSSVLTPSAVCVGQQLRTYRLALACTGEYAVAATGSATPTMAQTLAKIIISVNRVDGVYETEVAVRLVLVATETNVIFTNASTDPFTGNNNANTLINESQSVITNTIGSANFDIGHTFSTGGGGLAGLGVVCQNSQKASGITGSPSPVGDAYDIDYVAHEMGHQFGGNHTFNSTMSNCGGGNRNASTAVEPGSGITIMAYAGICGTDDLSAHSIAYFHAISYDEIVNYTHGASGNSCPVTTTTGNNPPVVTGSGNYVVPKSTPFILTGSGTDPDGDALTFSWEEQELGVAGTWNSGNRNYFMSYTPTPSPSRMFPKQSVVLSGNFTTTKGEYVPPSAQNLTFRLTARDNKMGGGGVCYAINTITISSAGPLAVTNPDATGIFWGVGTPQTITWAVNSTNLPPVSCDSVRVLISYDAGVTYSVLLGSTPNDGSELITAPTLTATVATCRIKVESKGNIFYDVSNNNFTISLSVGLNPLSKSNPIGLAVWPNPFNNVVNFSVGNLQSESLTEFKVIDVLGKTVLQKNYNNKTELNETLDLSNVSLGIYFISVTNNNRNSFYRVVKN
ncbi:MAG: T9SS type A sorting domain-containing protein [Bacteroidetes bacterium]|nr:T9SS type A sorting domain-containing protein [Bacteroidota bacterium]